LDDLYTEMVGPATQFGINLHEQLPQEGVPLYRRWLRKLFLTCYPVLNATYEGLFFLYQLMYLYDKTQYYTPFLHLQKLALKRLTLKDMEIQADARVQRRKLRLHMLDNYPLASFLRALVNGTNIVLDYSKYILPASIFFFRFLEWWYSENRIVPPALPTPPPPPPPLKVAEGLHLPEDKTLCPLCLSPRTNPAMASSGYVFCYPCIFNYVQRHEKCPVTFLPTTQAQIRKIYEAR